MSISGALTADENGAKLIISKPDTLNGTELSTNYFKNDLTLKYQGVSIPFDSDKYPKSAFAAIVFGILKNCSQQGCEYSAKNKQLSGIYDTHPYTVTVNDSGQPETIAVPDHSLTATLSQYSS